MIILSIFANFNESNNKTLFFLIHRLLYRTLQAWLLLLFILSGNFNVWAQSIELLQKRGNSTYRTDPKEALKIFDQAQKLALRNKQVNLAANILVDVATVYNVMYDNFQRATNVCRQGLQLAPLADSTRFKLLASLGELYHQRNRPDSLAWFWQRADTLLTVRPALEREARTYVAAFWGNRGTAYMEQGDYRQAERCFQKRLLLLGKLDTPVRLAIAENQFALFYRQVGQPNRADSLYSSSLQHYTTADLTRGWLLLGLIECRLYQQQTNSVLRLVSQAKQYTKQAGKDGAELSAYLDQSLGKYWELKNQPAKAKDFFSRSLATGQRLGPSNRLIWRGIMGLSRVAEQQNDLHKALNFVQLAIQQASIRFKSSDLGQNPAPADFLNGPELFEALCRKAHLLYLTKTLAGHLQLANQTYERAFTLSHILQGSYSAELTKLLIQEKLRPAYRESVAVAYACYRQHPDPASLETLLYRQEQGNAAVLNEMLKTLQNPYPNAPTYLIEQLHLAKSRLSAAKTAWIERSPKLTSQSIDDDLTNAELAWSRAYGQLRPYSHDSRAQPTTIARLQSQLGHQTALLQYSLTPDSLILTLVKSNRVQVLMLPVTGAELNQLCESLRREAYRNPDPFEYAGRSSAQALFKRLIGPVWTELQNIHRLVIVRDGPLHYLPFEILETGLRSDDYLLRYAAVTYAYSMHSVAEDRKLSPIENLSMLSMAPFAPTKTGIATARQWGYESLEASEKEAAKMSGTHSTAENANKSNFLALLPQHQLLHLATHAEASDTDPGNSYIAFFPDESSHRLYAHELEQLNLHAIRLAVLSACRTGNGHLHQGEGLLSLSRTFVSAGCPQVIASLWNAHDGTTATLTQLFYDELKTGQPTDIALQQAKLRFIAAQTAGGAFSPPHFWAHLILMGDHQPVFSTPSTWYWGWIGLGMVVLLTVITFSYYRQYRQRSFP